MGESTIRVELDLPRDVLDALDVAEHEAPVQLKRLIVLELFREERISSGKAAELLGLSKEAFVHLLGQYGIPYFTEHPDELAEQLEDVRRKLQS